MAEKSVELRSNGGQIQGLPGNRLLLSDAELASVPGSGSSGRVSRAHPSIRSGRPLVPQHPQVASLAAAARQVRRGDNVFGTDQISQDWQREIQCCEIQNQSSHKNESERAVRSYLGGMDFQSGSGV